MVGIAVVFAKQNTPLGQSDYRPSFSIRKNCLVIKKSPWSFGRYVLNFSSISFIPFDVSPAERGVDGCNGGQPVVALAYRPRAGARSFLAPMAWLFASSMRLLDP